MYVDVYVCMFLKFDFSIEPGCGIGALYQCFSNFTVYCDHLEFLFEMRVQGPTLRDCDSVDGGGDPKICLFSKNPGSF